MSQILAKNLTLLEHNSQQKRNGDGQLKSWQDGEFTNFTDQNVDYQEKMKMNCVTAKSNKTCLSDVGVNEIATMGKKTLSTMKTNPLEKMSEKMERES